MLSALSKAARSTIRASPCLRTTSRPAIRSSPIPTFQVSEFHTSLASFAVPKHKRSLQVRRTRRNSPYFQIKPVIAAGKCSNCSTLVRKHHVCKGCGWYRGQPVTLAAIKRHQKLKAAGVQNPTIPLVPEAVSNP